MEPDNFSGSRILLIEDTPAIIDLVRAELNKQTYEVYVATTGEKGVANVEKVMPDLILLDILMPGMDGYETCRLLKLNDKVAHIPVIFMSALSESMDKVKAFNLGAVDYINKPIDVAELKARVRNHLHIQHLQKQQKRVNEELDERVQIRTRELQESLERIQLINAELEEAKEKAEESDRLKTAFIDNISHEIRTPLNGVLGFVELLAESGIKDSQQKRYIQIIEKSSNRLLKIVSDLIDISHIRESQAEVYLMKQPVNPLLDELLAKNKMLFENKGLKLSCNKPLPKDESTIAIDAGRINQIISSLLDNALKFTKTGEVTFGYDVGDGVLVFYVKDTGIGISEDMHEVIFEHFRQNDISMSRGYEGAGLGLSISKAYIELHGGRIWVESEPGKGAIFRFTIPYATENREPNRRVVQHKTQVKKTSGKRKVLVAEDDDVSFSLIEMMLHDTELVLLRAHDGEEAIELFKQNQDVTFIMMDLKMPNMDGLEAIRHIRNLNSSVPIIAQTAFAHRNEQEMARRIGCSEYLTKPLHREKLLQAIAKVMPAE